MLSLRFFRNLSPMNKLENFPCEFVLRYSLRRLSVVLSHELFKHIERLKREKFEISMNVRISESEEVLEAVRSW